MKKYSYSGKTYGEGWWMNENSGCQENLETLIKRLEADGKIKVKLVYCDSDGDEFTNSDESCALEEIVDKYIKLGGKELEVEV